MSISIGKHEPSLRQPTVSVDSAAKPSRWLGAMTRSSGWPITSSSR